MDRQKLKKFLTELTDLSIKHGIVIEGCGCCGSPYLTEQEMTEDETYCITLDSLGSAESLRLTTSKMIDE